MIPDDSSDDKSNMNFNRQGDRNIEERGNGGGCEDVGGDGIMGFDEKQRGGWVGSGSWGGGLGSNEWVGVGSGGGILGCGSLGCNDSDEQNGGEIHTLIRNKLMVENEIIAENNNEVLENLEEKELDEIDLDEDPNVILSNIRKNNLNRLTIGHLNINFLAGKFEALKLLIKEKLDIFVLTETKIDESFPTNQFLIDGFSPPFRLDRNKHGGGVLIYISEYIICKEIELCSKPKDSEFLFIELNLRKKKWLLMGGYNPKKESISYFLEHVGSCLDKHMANYDNLLLLGDFNSTMSEEVMSHFCETYNLENLITDFTCYKSADNPTSIDVILTNRKNSFDHSLAIETGLSDHHKMVVTILKVYIKKNHLK